MSQNNYIAIKDCYTCLEHFLLYVDFGFSDALAGFLASLYHVTEDEARFHKLVQDLLRGRSYPRIKP